MNSTNNTELLFTQENIWIKMIDEFICIGGVSDFVLNEIGVIVDIEFTKFIENMSVHEGDIIGNLEALRDNFEIKSPIDGIITEVNAEIHDDPEIISESPYESGWIFKIEPKDPFLPGSLMERDEYLEYIR